MVSREITLLGQNVNAYNYHGKKLPYLIKKLNKINDLKKNKIHNVTSCGFSDDLIEILQKLKKFMPLIHLPVQSGSNKILKKYESKTYC